VIGWAARRPAVVWASAAALMLAGGVAFARLPLATRTSIELPRLSVSASWPGASAELLEAYVTAPLEAAVQGVRGVRRVDSESGPRGSNLTVWLDPRANVTVARLGILERLELLRRELPLGATPPVVGNYVPDELAEQPLIVYTVAGPYTPGTLADLVRRSVVPAVSAIPGVAGVAVQGGAMTGATVAYDPARLLELGIPPQALAAALAEARVVASIGEQTDRGSVVPVTLRDVPSSLEALSALPVRGPAGRTTALGEVAAIRPDEDAGGQFYRVDGEPAVSLTVARLPGADAIRTAARVREAIELLGAALPAGVAVRLQRDESTDLKRQLRGLALRGGIATVAVLVVLAIGFRDARATALVMLSAVLAVAGTALSLYLLGIPANLLTIAGLCMGVGILVQNGMVVVDRLRAVSSHPDARVAAATRVVPAVLGATLTTAVVMLPFLLLQGNARAAFVPFAASFALALGWSVLSSVVMLPAVAGRLRERSHRSRLARWYRRGLVVLLRWRWATVGLVAGVVVSTTWGFIAKVPRWAFGSWYGSSAVLSASLQFPRGSDPASLDRGMADLERVVVGRQGVDQVTATGSAERAFLRVSFTPDAAMMPYVLQEELTQRAVLIGGAAVSVHYQGPGFYSGGSGAAITQRIKLLGYSYEGLLGIARDLEARLTAIPRVRNVDLNAGSFGERERAFEVVLRPDRAALARHGLTAADLATVVGREVAGAIGGQQLVIGGAELRVTLKAQGARDRTMDQLAGTLIPRPAGGTVRIRDVAVVEEREVLSRISRQDQQYVRIVSYEFRGPARLAERTHRAFMQSIVLPPGYSASDEYWGWQADDSTKGLWLVFGVGVLLVVLVVAMVFDSLWATGMVFLGLPVALAGSAAAFWAAGAPFNREAAVGVVLVVGLAVNQIILVVDAALQRRRGKGRALHGLRAEDVVRAATDRGGMITLATFTALGSLVPLAVGAKTDDLFGAIALATVGGTVGGTVAALVFLPALLAGRAR
jgi:hydrophobic/amphiphilic exporter-1 (mainly G- bacteria), HAE1 family